ncbi:MAG: adenylate/guanylate cyclase domain-containing protein [Salibacteraceae bacterium]
MDQEKPVILYVDDEPANLRTFKAAFRREFKIHLAEGAAEAIEILRNKDVHLIITDQRMPETTGVEFLQSINNEFPDQVRMILTGFSDLEAVIEAINSANVYRYITKPWDEDELRDTILRAHKLYSLQKANKRLVSELSEKVSDLEKTMLLFRKYVPEEVVRESLEAKDGKSLLDGETREVAVMFTDIRNFTNISSKLEAHEVVEFLNDYLGVMNDIILKYNGTINKFMGDGILALFGAPINYPNNSENAVMCGLEMLEKVREVSQRYEEKFGREVAIGVGINTGKAVVGNIGSEQKVEYTVIGDVVNVAARIESLTKDKPNSILISESVMQQSETVVETSPREPVKVKGKDEPINVFEVLSRKH